MNIVRQRIKENIKKREKSNALYKVCLTILIITMLVNFKYFIDFLVFFDLKLKGQNDNVIRQLTTMFCGDAIKNIICFVVSLIIFTVVYKKYKDNKAVIKKLQK